MRKDRAPIPDRESTQNLADGLAQTEERNTLTKVNKAGSARNVRDKREG